MERATRDIVSIASYQEIMAGRGTPNGGVWLDATHLGTAVVEEKFPGMTERTRNVGQSLSEQRVEVSPTSHYHMGGVTIDSGCRSDVPGLFVAGEDAGGAHGANRLGGNGVVDSTVLGMRAGETVADYVEDRENPALDADQADRIVERVSAPLDRTEGTDVYELREELEDVMWEHVGVVRDGETLTRGIERIQRIREELSSVAVSGTRRYNLEWQQWMDVENLAVAAEMVARSARYRTESRGAHYREDYPDRNDAEWLSNVYVKRDDDGMQVWDGPVDFTRLHPDDVEEEAPKSEDAGPPVHD
jgi:succinate dehydrogenase / fumarate reductase flavoprotein subunit/fumarate reductase flavoprotein subunit